jgi:hypothetical protein
VVIVTYNENSERDYEMVPQRCSIRRLGWVVTSECCIRLFELSM